MEINKENQNKKRLGRGLGSLFNSYENAETTISTEVPTNILSSPAASQHSTKISGEENKVWSIAVDKLVPGAYQPRRNFDKEALSELTNSIKQSGIIQPITVRKIKTGGFEILAGERRWRAAQAAGLHEVPAIIKTYTDREALQVALIENIQREDLDVLEEAESYQRLMEEFSLSQQEAAEKVGKERSTVANAIRLLALPVEIREMLTKKQISAGHAKVLLSIVDEKKQIELAKKTANDGLSVRALELEVKARQKNLNTAKPVKSDSTAGALSGDLAEKLAIELADQLQKAMGTKVEINYKLGKGSVQVFFYSDDQLTQIYEKLKS